MTPNAAVFAVKGRARPDLAAAWQRQRPRNPDVARSARKVVEKIRAAWATGAFVAPPWAENYTEETPEIREAYHRLLAEPMVKVGYGSKVWSVAALDCQVIPAEPDDERHRQAAKAMRWVLNQLGTGVPCAPATGPALVAYEVLSGALINGWSLCELVPALDVARRGPAAGKEFWTDFKAKDTRRLALRTDEFKNVTAVKNLYSGGVEYEGPQLDSFVIYAHWPLYRSPHGMSDFRAVIRACWIKDVAMKLRALGLDRYTHPYLKATLADPAQRQEMYDALQEARGEGFVIAPPGVLIDAISLAVGSDAVFKSAIEDLNQEILIGLTWSHLVFKEGQQGGVRGDTQVQKGTNELCQWALAATLTGVATGQIVRRWYDRNYPDIEPASAAWGNVNEQALLASANLDDVLTNKLKMPLSMKERRTYYGRPAPADDADKLGGDQGQGGQPPGQPPPAPPAAFSEAGSAALPFPTPPPGW